MADQDIQFKVTADVQDAKQGFEEVQQKIDGVKGSATETVPVMDEVAKTMDDAGGSAEDMGGGISMLSELLTMGLVVGAIAGSLALIGLAKDMLTVDSEVENLTAKLKEHWSETFKVNQEWERFREELTKFTTAELIESLQAVDAQVLSIGNRLAGIQLLKITEALGITNFEEALQMLKSQRDMITKELFGTPDTLGWADVSKDMQKKWKDSFKDSQKKVSESADDGWKLAAKAADEYIKKLVEAVEKEIDGYDKITTHKNKIMGSLLSPKKTKGKPGPGFDDEDVRRAFLEENAFFLDTAISSAGILRNEFMTVWTDVFGEANSLFEKFVANMVEQLANLAATNLMGSILNFIVPGLGTAAGMVMSSGSTSSVINLQLDNQTMGSWYVSGKNQAERLRLS